MTNSKSPSVTIVIPAKNEEENIARCLESVNLLEYPAQQMKLIVVDNLSSDKTVEVAQKMGATVVTSNALSVAAVRNAGAKYCESDLIAFLDADTVVPPDWLKVGVSFLKPSDVSAVGFAMRPPRSGSTWVENVWYGLSSLSAAKGTRNVEWLASFNLIVKRDCYQRVKGFDESLISCEDVDFGYKLNEFSHLVSSDVITVEHCGSDDHLLRFFLKEIWRGQGALQIVRFSKTKRWKDLISLFVPLLFLVLQLLIVVSAFFNNFLCLVLLIMCVFILLIVHFLKVSSSSLVHFIQAFIILYLYLSARGIAIVVGFCNNIKRGK